MKVYNIRITAYIGSSETGIKQQAPAYSWEREYFNIKCIQEGTGINRALREFWKEKVNKRRRRKTTKLKIEVEL